MIRSLVGEVFSEVESLTSMAGEPYGKFFLKEKHKDEIIQVVVFRATWLAIMGNIQRGKMVTVNGKMNGGEITARAVHIHGEERARPRKIKSAEEVEEERIWLEKSNLVKIHIKNGAYQTVNKEDCINYDGNWMRKIDYCVNKLGSSYVMKALTGRGLEKEKIDILKLTSINRKEFKKRLEDLVIEAALV